VRRGVRRTGWCEKKLTTSPPPTKVDPSSKRRGKTISFYYFIIMKTFNRRSLKDKRKNLRNNSTQAETFLWGYLKNSQFEGRKFRRQTSIKNYIVDFYCPQEKLVIELDGDFHFDEKAIKDDEKRTKEIEADGIKVIRFENQEVLLNLDKVLKEIKSNFRRD
jgi:very-short-patch-repair endonuclease